MAEACCCSLSAVRLDAAIKNIECRVKKVEMKMLRNEGNMQEVERRMDTVENNRRKQRKEKLREETG